MRVYKSRRCQHAFSVYDFGVTGYVGNICRECGNPIVRDFNIPAFFYYAVTVYRNILQQFFRHGMSPFQSRFK